MQTVTDLARPPHQARGGHDPSVARHEAFPGDSAGSTMCDLAQKPRDEHTDRVEESHQHVGWVSYTDGPHGKDHLPPDVQTEVERWEALREERQGRLLCEVQVRVYEHDVDEGTEMQVSFPAGAVLGINSDRDEVAAAVARARAALAGWR
jgi:hypothetical protein